MGVVNKKVHVDMKIVPRKYNRVQDVNRLIRYITNPEKTPSGLIGGIGVNAYDIEQMCRDFSRVRRVHDKKYGRLAKQIILSVDRKDNVDPERMLECAKEVAVQVFPNNQCVYAVHENHDANKLHAHIAINTINYETGLKLDFGIGDIGRIRNVANEVINGKAEEDKEDYTIMDLL